MLVVELREDHRVVIADEGEVYDRRILGYNEHGQLVFIDNDGCETPLSHLGEDLVTILDPGETLDKYLESPRKKRWRRIARAGIKLVKKVAPSVAKAAGVPLP